MDDQGCEFVAAWVGRCRQPVEAGATLCSEHRGLLCVSCGQPATRTCEATNQMVCGELLCDECEHELAPNGTTCFGGHCRKGQQTYRPWHEMTPEERIVGDVRTDIARYVQWMTLIENSSESHRAAGERFLNEQLQVVNEQARRHPEVLQRAWAEMVPGVPCPVDVSQEAR